MLFGSELFDVPVSTYILLSFILGYFLNTKVLKGISVLICAYVAFSWLTIPDRHWHSWGGLALLIITFYSVFYLSIMWVTAKRHKIWKILKAMKSEVLN